MVPQQTKTTNLHERTSAVLESKTKIKYRKTKDNDYGNLM